MKNTHDNPPAFPVSTEWLPGFEHLNGMTLRDYFAAKALQGLLSDPNTEGTKTDAFALAAYSYADAMLSERTKQKEQ